MILGLLVLNVWFVWRVVVLSMRRDANLALALYSVFTFFVYCLATVVAKIWFGNFYELPTSVVYTRISLGLVLQVTIYLSLLINPTGLVPHKLRAGVYYHRGWRIYALLGSVILVLYILGGGLQARESLGNEIELGGMFHVIRGVFDLLYLILFIVLVSNRFYGHLLFIATTVLMGLGGHRGLLVSFIVVYLLYLISVGRFKLNYKVFVFASITMLILLNITFNRFSGDINKGYILLDRLYEPTIDRIITYEENSGRRFGFEHFERIITMPIPSIIFNSKPNNDDKDEVLSEYYGLEISTRSHWPLPFLVDAYRRFGYIGTIVFSMLLVFALRHTWTVLCRSNLWPIAAFVCAFAYRLFSFSVLGTIAFWLYSILKILILFLILESLIKVIYCENFVNSSKQQ